MSTDKDDQHWLDALAGRPNAAGGEADPRAQALRQALLAQRARELADAAPDEGLERLLFRLRREGLLEKEHKPMGLPALLALAASVLLVVGVGWHMMIGYQSALEPRASVPQQAAETPGASAVQVLQDARPAELAAALQQEFGANGITLAQSAVGDTYRLEADLPEPLSPGALATLARHALALPQGKKLIIEIRPLPPEQ
jgi:hypothetical protein